MFDKPKRDVHSVFIHCSATDHPDHDNKEFIRKIHVDQNGWSDIGYHYFIDKAGHIHPCRPIDKIPAAQKGHNTGSIAICLSGEHDFTENQTEALIELCYEIQDAYTQRLAFRGHREVNPHKSCPVLDYKRVLNLSDRGYLRERRRNINDSTTITASKVAAGTTLAGAVANNIDLEGLANNIATVSTSIEQAQSVITNVISAGPIILAMIALGAIGWIVLARIKDWEDGVR